MISRQLQGRVGNPFVRQGTVKDMAAVAKSLAMVRAAAEEIKRAEVVLQSSPKDSRAWMKANESMALAGQKGREWCHQAVDTLNAVKRKSESYLRGL